MNTSRTRNPIKLLHTWFLLNSNDFKTVRCSIYRYRRPISKRHRFEWEAVGTGQPHPSSVQPVSGSVFIRFYLNLRWSQDSLLSLSYNCIFTNFLKKTFPLFFISVSCSLVKSGVRLAHRTDSKYDIIYVYFAVKRQLQAIYTMIKKMIRNDETKIT